MLPLPDLSKQIISEIINHSDGIKSRLIRIYIKWDDSENATMTNAEHTRTTFSEDYKALLDVSIAFTQITEATAPIGP